MQKIPEMRSIFAERERCALAAFGRAAFGAMIAKADITRWRQGCRESTGLAVAARGLNAAGVLQRQVTTDGRSNHA